MSVGRNNGEELFNAKDEDGEEIFILCYSQDKSFTVVIGRENLDKALNNNAVGLIETWKLVKQGNAVIGHPD